MQTKPITSKFSLNANPSSLELNSVHLKKPMDLTPREALWFNGSSLDCKAAAIIGGKVLGCRGCRVVGL
jgi:hypothetical protein